MSKEKEMIPIERVTSELETTKLKIIVHLHDGLLSGEKIDGEWFITTESVETFKLNHQGKKVARKCDKGCVGTSSCAGCN